MKFLVFCISFLSIVAFAQEMGIKDIPANGDTTIKIQKGTEQNKYEITTSEDEIEGDAAPLLKDARENWKKACDDWKKEIKENKENSIVSLSCGHMKCSTTAMETTCTSSAKSKIRVKVQ